MFKININGLLVAAFSTILMVVIACLVIMEVAVLGSRIVTYSMESEEFMFIIKIISYMVLITMGFGLARVTHYAQGQLSSKLKMQQMQNIMQQRSIRSNTLPAGYVGEIARENAKAMLYEAKTDAIIWQRRYEVIKLMQVPGKWYQLRPTLDQAMQYLAGLVLIEQGKLFDPPPQRQLPEPPINVTPPDDDNMEKYPEVGVY